VGRMIKTYGHNAGILLYAHSTDNCRQ
jgi:hypothetical protein